jgi:CubicO group peptidase (beta-lactamase class C family)
MIIKYLSFLFFPACLGLSLCSFGQLTPKETKVIAELSKNLNDDIRKDKLHGSISAAIIRKGQVIWAGAYGYSNMEKDTPADTGTIYRIASMTKTFTATLLMQLMAEGKVGLDDPADKYVPEIKSLPGYSNSRAFTLRQLASHTSGLNREPELPDASQGSTDQWEDKVLSCIPYTSFNSGPGEKFLYSNIGYALLGLALERASGVPYIQMVQERIFTPLHMDNSFFSVPADKRDRLAEGMNNKRDGAVNTSLPLSAGGRNGLQGAQWRYLVDSPGYSQICDSP